MDLRPQATLDDYNFKLYGGDKEPFLGYISSLDPTISSPRSLVQGSKNVYKSRKGTIAVRPGKKRRGSADNTGTGVTSSFEWETSFSSVYPMRVLAESAAGGDGKLQFESTIADGITPVWYSLLTNLTLTRFVFDTWWDDVQSKDRLLMVKGDPDILSWSGGVAKLASFTTVHGSVATVTAPILGTGTAYTTGDILTIPGGSGDVQVQVTDALGGVIFAVGSPISTRGSGYSAGTVSPTGGTGTGASLSVLIEDTVSITNSEGLTWHELGFADDDDHPEEFVIQINSNSYSYLGGVDTTTLQGLSTTIVTEPIGSIVIQRIVTQSNAIGSTFNIDFQRVVGNQVYVGSYDSRVVYSSADGDFRDFTNSGSHVYGDPAIMTFDQQVRGIGEQGGKICIFAGLDLLYLVTPNVNVTYTYTGTDGAAVFVYNQVEKVPLASFSAADAHEFIGNFGGYLVWKDQSNQLRALGTFTDNLAKQPIYFSLPVWDELKAEDFTGGSLKVVDDMVNLIAPITGNTWIYQERQIINELGQITSEKIWYPPQVWGISRIALVDGLVFGHSSSNPQMFQLWETDQYHDDTSSDSAATSYKCVARFGYARDKRSNVISFNKLFTEGYILENSPLNMDVLFDYQGSEMIVNAIIQAADDLLPADAIFMAPLTGIIGGDEIGASDIGGADGTNFPKFRVIGSTDSTNCFEYLLQFWTDTADARWEILTYGSNTFEKDILPTFINKSIS